jgi:tellurite resistance protein
MSDTPITVISTVEIDRPVDLVRQQFFDIDHAMRDKVHDGVKIRWLPPREPGERRILQEVRVLGVLYADEILVEFEDGTLIKRFVEGPNKGTVFVETFEAKSPSKTVAQIRAVVPLTGFKWAVGPIFKLAVKKALDKALMEHKRDIEGGYTPGRARGNVEAAIDFIRPLADRAKSMERDADRVAIIAPLIEAACVTAIADDELDDAERDAIRAVTHAIGVRPLDDAAIEAVVASSIDHTRRHGVEQRCNDLGAKLKKLGLAEEGLGVATLIAQVSHGVDQSELAALQLLARAAGVSEARLVEVIQRVDQSLSR